MKRIVIGDSNSSWLCKGSIDNSVYDKFCKDYENVESSEPLTISIRSHGGTVLYSLLIGNIISSHFGPVTIEVPGCALSAASFLVLLGDEIVVCRHATLSPFDPQMYGISLRDIIKSFPPEDTGFKALIRNFASSKSQSINESYIRILLRKYSPEEVEEIKNVFIEGRDHDSPIFINELPECVSKKIRIEKINLPSEPKPSTGGLGGLGCLLGL